MMYLLHQATSDNTMANTIKEYALAVAELILILAPITIVLVLPLLWVIGTTTAVVAG
jgi:hypothetical protein